MCAIWPASKWNNNNSYCDLYIIWKLIVLSFILQARKESVDTEEATISSTGLQVTDKEAKLIGKILFID